MIALDQLTKHWIVARFELYERLEILPVFNLTLAYNTGAAFSFLAGAGGWQRWFFAGVALIAAVLILSWLRKLRTERMQGAALALILGAPWATSMTGWYSAMWWIFSIFIGAITTSRPLISPTAPSQSERY